MALYTNIALKATQGESPFKYLGVLTDAGENQGYLNYSTDAVLTKNAKFAVEYADRDFFHLRSCLTNKYWARSTKSEDWIVAQQTEPVIDKTSWACTLFKMEIDVNGKAKFRHVQSGSTVRISNGGYSSSRKMFFTIDPIHQTEAISSIVDYDTLVILPKYVAFKGSNGLFYRNSSNHDMKDAYSDFSVSDIGDPNIVCEIRNTSDGHIEVKVGVAAKNYVWASRKSSGVDLIVSELDNPLNIKQIFEPVMIDKSVVALRNLGNNKFCVRADFPGSFTKKEKKDCLLASEDGAVRDAHLEVVEPVIRRTVTVYEFDLSNARVYGVTPLFSHEHIWDNHGDTEQTGSAKVTISTTRTRTYSNTVTVSGSVDTTFEAGIPYIAKGEIKVSASGSYARQWGKTESEAQVLEHNLDVTLKPERTTIAKGVATEGKCDVPFSYVQTDFPADGGPPTVTILSNGIFTGVNAYGFHDDFRDEPLSSYTGPADQAPNKCIKRPVVTAERGEKILQKSNL